MKSNWRYCRVQATGPVAGTAVSFEILDGSYVPELDANDNPTGNTVFDREADTVTLSFPRCGEGNVPTFTRIGLMEFREDAGTIRVPVNTIAGGRDANYAVVILTNLLTEAPRG